MTVCIIFKLVYAIVIVVENASGLPSLHQMTNAISYMIFEATIPRFHIKL
jgi:hypothetical protein